MTLARGETPILSNISFEASPGEWILLVGRNGAGKSTLLDALAGIAVPLSGEILCRGEGDEPVRPTYLPQAPERLLFATPAAEEFAASLRLPSAEVRNRWSEWVAPRLAPLGLGHLRPDDLPSRLSTGMQRKFVYAMALARPGQVLLCDEPTSGLDAASRAEILDEIERFVEQGGLAITALHDLDEALFRATRVLALADGRIAFDGTPQAFVERALPLAEAGVPVPPSVRLALALAASGGPAPSLCRPRDLAAKLLEAPATGQPAEKAAPPAHAQARFGTTGEADEASAACGAAAASHEGAMATPVTPRKADFHPALRWLIVTALTIAIALVHRPWGDLAAVIVTLALLCVLRAAVRTTLRLTWTWASFAALACAVSGLQLGPPFHARWAFHPAAAQHTLLEVVPYWCFLQLGQLALARFSSLQFAALAHRALARLVPRRQRLVVSWFGALVTRFIPAVDAIYREQWYAYRVRCQNAGRAVTTSRLLVDVANVIAPFVIRMLRFGETTADAMEARRLFEVPPPSALLPEWRVRGKDAGLMAIAAAGLALLVWTR